MFVISVEKMCGGGVSALSGACLWPADKILGATVRIVGLTNGGATNVLFFVVLVFVLMMVMGMGGAQCQK